MSFHLPFRHHQEVILPDQEALQMLAERQAKEAFVAQNVISISFDLEQNALDFLDKQRPSTITFQNDNPIVIQRLSSADHLLILSGVLREVEPTDTGKVRKLTEFAIVHLIDGSKKLSISQQITNGHIDRKSGYYDIKGELVQFYSQGVEPNDTGKAVTFRQDIKPTEFTTYPISDERSYTVLKMLEPLPDTIASATGK